MGCLLAFDSSEGLYTRACMCVVLAAAVQQANLSSSQVPAAASVVCLPFLLAQPSPQEYQPRFTSELRQPTDLTPEQLQAVQAAPDVDPALANAMLQRLQGRRVNYYAFARDTPQGKDCECTLLVARACLVQLPAVSGAAGTGTSTCCLAVELVGDRFLRRMVRVLVGTLVREVVAGSGEDALLVLAQSLERPATAGPAPALGLCFAGVGFS